MSQDRKGKFAGNHSEANGYKGEESDHVGVVRIGRQMLERLHSHERRYNRRVRTIFTNRRTKDHLQLRTCRVRIRADPLQRCAAGQAIPRIAGRTSVRTFFSTTLVLRSDEVESTTVAVE